MAKKKVRSKMQCVAKRIKLLLHSFVIHGAPMAALLFSTEFLGRWCPKGDPEAGQKRLRKRVASHCVTFSKCPFERLPNLEPRSSTAKVVESTEAWTMAPPDFDMRTWVALAATACFRTA